MTPRDLAAVREDIRNYRLLVAVLARERRSWVGKAALWRLKAAAAGLLCDDDREVYADGLARRCYAEAQDCHERRALLLQTIRGMEADLCR